MKTTRKCYGCKQSFPVQEMVQYSTLTGATAYWYCIKCLVDRQERDYFSDQVCRIFGIKSPGPILWTQRKRIKEQYGYTDEVIIECLEYMYNVAHYKKLSETLVLVTPTNVEKALRYKQTKDNQGKMIATALAQAEYKNMQVKVQENVVEQDELNPDDFLYDE